MAWIVPFTTGGSTDVIGRTLSQKLQEAFVVDNKPGAAGAVGASYVAKARPDGYTLFGGTISTHAINASLYKNLAYDPVRDFEPVALLKKDPTRRSCNQLGMEIVGSTPEELAAHMGREIPRWAALVKKSGATAN